MLNNNKQKIIIVFEAKSETGNNAVWCVNQSGLSKENTQYNKINCHGLSTDHSRYLAWADAHNIR